MINIFHTDPKSELHLVFLEGLLVCKSAQTKIQTTRGRGGGTPLGEICMTMENGPL